MYVKTAKSDMDVFFAAYNQEQMHNHVQIHSWLCITFVLGVDGFRGAKGATPNVTFAHLVLADCTGIWEFNYVVCMEW